MFYKATHQNELSRAQMNRVRKGFRGTLVKLRYSPQFIVNNCDELLAIAHSEYVKAVDDGVEIEDPVTWTIHCAWRRTQNLLHAEGYRPRMVSSEKVSELADESAPTPEQLAEDEDRARKIRRAVETLDEDQRKLIALTYFEGMSVREAGRYLNWHASTAQRCHEAALRNLRRRLPVSSSDELEVDVGLIAWLSFASAGSAFHLPGGFEAVLEKAGHGASGLWARMHDLARRFTVGGGSDAAGAVASSGAGRAAGVCATGVAIVCFAGASGIVGPGVGGGIGLLEGTHDPPHHAKAAAKPTVLKESSPILPFKADSSTVASAATEPTSSRPSAEAAKSARAQAEAAQAATEKSESKQVKAQTSGIARAGSESTTTPSSASTSTESTATETVTVTPTTSSPSSAEAAQARQQFSAFK